ncbi:LarC family nickel insertion protein [Lentilactobacillus parafarraginis]|uniref:LarC family nickel insertion protein n=1 Tax=Lentilactobacillus parafarraginis TaxID=390842 RepID=A0A5R9D008_9LACO|nr:LarC family nickel insertion protein [Lentilactobacillus parafarraginis]
MIDANIDDQSPETLAPVIDQLMDAGALDAYFTPIQMKKNRPATQFSVLVQPADRDRLAELVLRLTTTIGVRYQTLNRTVMNRDFETVQTQFGAIRVKVATFKDIAKRTPEFEDCLAAAKHYHVALQDVYQAVYRKLD